MIQIAEYFSENPVSPMNLASQDAAFTTAAYRFFANPKAKPEKILQLHIQQTLKRMESHPIVLAIQNTTSLACHSHKNTHGVRRNFNGENLWARGYAVSTVGFEKVPSATVLAKKNSWLA